MHKLLKSALPAAYGLLFSGLTFAQDSITDVPETDESYEYLRYIFGVVVNVIVGGEGPDAVDSVLGAMSSVMAAGMLVFTGIVITYVLISGVLDSANEGNPGGKALNQMWVPLRMILAMGLVLPLAGGYSAMQVAVLWVAGHGIGLADSVWNRALDHIESTGTLYPPDIGVDYEGIADNILQSRVCMHAIRILDAHINIVEDSIENLDESNDPSLPAYTVMQRYTNFYNEDAAADAWQAAKDNDYANGHPRFYPSKSNTPCGSISLTFATVDESTGFGDIMKDFYFDISSALGQLDEELDPIARDIAESVHDEGVTEPDRTAYNTAVQNYKTRYQQAVTNVTSEISTARISKWDGGNPANAMSTVGSRDAGWITAGAWYWDLQKTNAEALSAVSITPKYSPPTITVDDHSEYDKFTNALAKYNRNKIVTTPGGGTAVAMERSSYADDDSNANAILNGFLKRLQSASQMALDSPDPVTGLQNLGHTMLWAIDITWLTTVTVTAAAETTAETAENSGLGLFGAGAGPRFFAELFKSALSTLAAVILFLTPLALFLAFYLPATPLILWIMGVAGWFILLIEAVIAAPIWAASHAMPEGNGFVGQRAMAGYMVLLSLFLRPTLMLFGLFASMLLMIVMAKVVMLLFIPAMSSINAGYLTGLLSYIGITAIFVFLIVHIAHRAYGLIHEIPDKVLRYIGGGNENLGEASAENQGKTFFVGGAAKLEKAASVGGAQRPSNPHPQGVRDNSANSRADSVSGVNTTNKTNQNLSTDG